MTSLNNYEIFAYSSLLTYEFNYKVGQLYDGNSVERVIISSFVSKKRHNGELVLVKLYKLISTLTRSHPLSKLTNTFITLKSFISSSRSVITHNPFLFFLLNYLNAGGRYGISPLFISKNQVTFTFQDYNFLSNFLDVGYDFFNWRYTVKGVINFKTANSSFIKMLLLSLVY